MQQLHAHAGINIIIEEVIAMCSFVLSPTAADKYNQKRKNLALKQRLDSVCPQKRSSEQPYTKEDLNELREIIKAIDDQCFSEQSKPILDILEDVFSDDFAKLSEQAQENKFVSELKCHLMKSFGEEAKETVDSIDQLLTEKGFSSHEEDYKSGRKSPLPSP